MSNQVLQKLVEMRGIESNYVDAWGKPATIADSSKAKLLHALGYETENEAAVLEQVKHDTAAYWQSVLDPVQVLRQSQRIHFTVRLPIELVNDSYTLLLTTESGKQFSQDLVPVDTQLINVAEIDEVEYQEYAVAFDHALEDGYHTLQLLVEGDDEPVGQMRIIMAPDACYMPEQVAKGKKAWGLSVQLYCVRSENNWGIGDFSDLSRLVKDAADTGADFIGLNPIHALYPANPDACSPYGPSSRRWLNYLYLDVTRLEGYDHPDVQALVNAPDFCEKLDLVRRKEYVDYAGVAELKLKVLTALFEVYQKTYLASKTPQREAFAEFVSQGGESLDMLAVYDVMQEHLKDLGEPSWGWPVFPDKFKEYHKPEVAKFARKNKQRVQFYQFLQWQAALQLEEANQVAVNAGMTIGLYRDLAVGVSEGSAEIWGNKDLYCVDASVGAPPDVLGPLGQNWGLPPMDPKRLYEQAYQPIVDLFSSNMASAGALRIDHVMALLRLWWVPKGDHARDGGYVYYPVDDLLGILALESHRNKSLVIGEDLGTVPEEIRGKLADNGIYSYRVFFFEQAEDGGFFSPSHYPVQSMSTLTTHDMPTLIGYWHCLDLELGKSLGLYPTDEILETLYTSRHEDKQEILNSLHGHHSVGEDVGHDVNYTGMNQALNFGLQTHMATGSSALLSLQLEDWLQMDKPVNIPGTFDEYPNWRRKLSRNLEDIFSDDDILHLANRLTQARRSASTD